MKFYQKIRQKSNIGKGKLKRLQYMLEEVMEGDFI